MREKRKIKEKFHTNIKYFFRKEIRMIQGINSGKCIAYVDGSFNIHTGECGYGIVLFFDDKTIEFSGSFHDAFHLGRNVHGEILGSMRAVKEAINLGAKEINIRYDYTGIEKWVTGEWQTKKSNTQEYRDFMRNAGKDIKITFTKIKAHSHNQWNDRADELAKQAIGV